MNGSSSFLSQQQRRRRETVVSLLLALIAMALILTVAGTVALSNVEDIKNKVENFFQIDLDTRQRLVADTLYARDEAARITKNLIHGNESELFNPGAGGTEETPTAIALAPAPLPPHPLGRERTLASSPDLTRRILTPAERRALRRLSRSQLPLVALKKIGGPARGTIPDLAAIYKSGQLGDGGLGRPGQTFTAPRPLAMPSAPSPQALIPAAAKPPWFVLPKSVGETLRRLVSERPRQGYPSLDQDIRAVFTVHRPPGSEAAYFRLRLSLVPESRVPAIPKDTLFLIDISQSISPGELAQVRRAVSAYLAALPPADRWNIAVFSETARFLHQDALFVEAGRFQSSQADAFIDRQRHERRTDVFRAVQLVLSRIPAAERPCNVFLISDGKATHGTAEVHRIVHDFQRVNRENFSIFTFNAGPGGNLYLLRLLSYRSRGYLESEPDLARVPQTLAAFLQRYDLPVLTHVVASYTNIKADEVYPEVLPNLYRKYPITFWGRAAPGKQVALRIAGRGRNGPREFFFRATVPPGDAKHPEVLREWARGKAHALMARLADEPRNQSLRQALVALARRHELKDISEMVERKGWSLPLPWKKKK